MRVFPLILTSFLFAALASADLVTNSGFELNSNAPGLVNGISLNNLNGSAKWDVYQTIPGWTTSAGSGIEIQTNGTLPGVVAHSGNRYVELDSHPNNVLGNVTNSSMSQTIFLTSGWYDLDYWYRPRTDIAGDNGIAVTLNGSSLGVNANGIKSSMDFWSQYETSFYIPSAGLQTLTFSAFGYQTTYGGLIDDISLGAVVPEPSFYGVLAAGLGVLFLKRRRS